MISEKRRNRKFKRAERRTRSRKKRALFFSEYKQLMIKLCASAMLAAFAFILAVSVAALALSSEKIVIGGPAEMKLRYNKPASKIFRKPSVMNAAYSINKNGDIFQQASLPIGNGDLGASIFGEIDCEKVIINHKTLWLGGPYDGETDYNGGNTTQTDADGKNQSEYYYEIQNLLLRGDTKSAEKLFEKIVGDKDNRGDYLCWGELLLDFNHKKRAKNYQRVLNIDNAIAGVSYKIRDTLYKREYLASNPDNVIAAAVSADGPDLLNLTIRFPSAQGAVSIAADDTITIGGTLNNGLIYYSMLSVKTDSGKVEAEADGLKISGAKNVYIYLSAATDYADNFPVYRTGENASELKNRVTRTVRDAIQKGYQSIKSDHIGDYKSLYGRVCVNLGGKESKLPTDKLISKYNTPFLKSSERKYLEQLLFNYGRYLLISSSRANSLLPANLQGVWNASNSPPWGADYHINVNLQMNYWPAFSTNLAECAEPLVKFVEALREPGRITAKTYTAKTWELESGLSDEAYGFIANTECNPYGYTGPGKGKYRKAQWSPAAVAWLLQNLYDGYEYGRDKNYLERIYPLMKEAARFFERTLADDGHGRLITAPSYSPEHGPLSAGTTYEQSLVWQLFTDTAEAAEILNIDIDKIAVWKDIISKLKPIEIGKSGQIKEWPQEGRAGSIGQPAHRHTSHLLGLFPGDLFDKNKNPEWIEAARVSLLHRGRKATGWAMGQRINTWARIGDGNEAYEMIRKLFRYGIYPNLWDAHPPFQIDGNFGYTAGVSEMLMQSNLGYIELLPALPSAWPQGDVSGLVARGSFVLNYRWENSLVDEATVISNIGGHCILRFVGAGGKKVFDKNGMAVPLGVNSANEIHFETEAGEHYNIQ